MTKERAKLQFDLEDQAPAELSPVPVDKIKETARSAGFLETPRRSESSIEDHLRRRARRKTGRIHQFATRLNEATLSKIYAYSDRHEITLAETIEHAITALENSEKAAS